MWCRGLKALPSVSGLWTVLAVVSVRVKRRENGRTTVIEKMCKAKDDY